MTIIKNESKILLMAGFVVLCLIFQPSIGAFAINAPLDSEFNLKIGESANIDSKFQITFLNVTSDSRCPADVVCIWQGEVSVKLNVTKDGKISDHTLTLGENENLETKTFDKYFIRLLKVEPYPFSSNPIKSSEYVATLFASSVEDVEIVKSPLKQFKAGASLADIQCRDNLLLVIKSSDDSPACVKPKTVEKLILRGWAQDLTTVDSFEKCAAAGNPVMESYPRQCRTSDGKNFVEKIDSRMMSPESRCNNHGGNWLEEFSECEFISAEQCSEMNGMYKECESACRHMPDAEVCIAMCVPVCVIPQE